MTELEVVEIMKEAIFVLIKVSAPALLAALVVGLLISLFQALTQIQEMTLTFVPKILAIFLVLIISMPFMMRSVNEFTVSLMDRIVSIE